MIKIQSKKVQRAKRHMRTKNIKGSASCPRVSIFRSNRYISVQLVDDAAHKTLLSVTTQGLGFKDGKNIEAATKLGQLLAEKAKALNIENVVFDRSGYIYHGRIKAVAEAAREGGLKF